jgi:hypothetical protein
MNSSSCIHSIPAPGNNCSKQIITSIHPSILFTGAYVEKKNKTTHWKSRCKYLRFSPRYLYLFFKVFFSFYTSPCGFFFKYNDMISLEIYREYRGSDIAKGKKIIARVIRRMLCGNTIWRKNPHFKKFQSGLSLGPSQRTLKKKSKFVMSVDQYFFFT